MATLISSANGVLTAAGTWKTVSAVANAEIDSEASSINLTTSNSDSTAFIPAATAIDAIALKLGAAISPTGTLTVTLRNSTTATDARTVTINASDLATQSTSTFLGWHVFSFASITPNGTDSYVVRVTRSVADSTSNRIPLACSTAAAANMSRAIRLTTTAAPSSGDKLIIAGEFTGAAASTSYTVTMDNADGGTLNLGQAVGTNAQSISVNNKATLAFDTTGSTNYYLKFKGLLSIYPGGTMTVGTLASPIPSSSTARIEFASVTNVDAGIRVFNGGSFTSYGATKTITKTLMTADKSATDTTLSLVSTSGWAANDVLWIASTTQTAADCETKTVLSVDSGVAVTLTAGLTNAHSGTSPTQAEVANITRNVKIAGSSTSLQGFLDIQALATVVCGYTEFFNMGSATTNKRGVDCNPTTGSASFTGCSFHDFTVSGSLCTYLSAATANNVTVSNCVYCNNGGYSIYVTATTGTNIVIDNNLSIRNTSTGVNAMVLADVGVTFTNNTVVGNAGNTVTLGGIFIGEVNAALGTFSGNTSHSNATTGIVLGSSNMSGTISDTTCWRNLSGGGIHISGLVSDITFDGLTLFGNSTINLYIPASGVGTITINDASIYGGSTFVSTIGIRFDGTLGMLILNSVVFGSPSAHSTSDMFVFTSGYFANGIFNNCLFGSSAEFGGTTNLSNQSVFGSSRHDQTDGNHKAWKKAGNITIDTGIYRSASPSERLTPNNASLKLTSGCRKVAVNDGESVTINVYVRQSSWGDGTVYNGNYPRLILKRNDSLGITDDTVIDTATVVGVGGWELLSGTTATAIDNGVMEFVIDCNGTTGWINIDDWSVG